MHQLIIFLCIVSLGNQKWDFKMIYDPTFNDVILIHLQILEEILDEICLKAKLASIFSVYRLEKIFI